jgi:hypothetical protein
VVDGVGQKRHSDGDLYEQTTDKVWVRGEDMEDRCQRLEDIRSFLTGVYGRGDGFRLGFTRGNKKYHIL